MIVDMEVSVQCDRPNCMSENALVHVLWGEGEGIRAEVNSILPKIGWVVDGGKHFCCKECHKRATKGGSST